MTRKRHSLSLLLVGLGVLMVAVYTYFSAAERNLDPERSDGILQNATKVTHDERDTILEGIQQTPSNRVAIITEFQPADPQLQQEAWDLASKKIESVPGGRIKRWRMVDVRIERIIPDGLEGDEFPTELRLEFFPDQELIATQTRLRRGRNVPSIRWSGIAVSPMDSSVSGTLSVHLIQDPTDLSVDAYIHYTDKYQDLHIVPVDNSEIHVAVETDRNASVSPLD